MQATIKAKSRMAKPKNARVHANSIAELNDELFAAIYSNLQLYDEVVVQSVDEKDQIFASNVQKSIYKVIERSQKVMKELRKDIKPEKRRALESELGEYAKNLENFQHAITKSAAFTSTKIFRR